MAYQRIGSDLHRVGTLISPRSRLTTVLNRIQLLTPFSSPFPEEALHLDLVLLAGEAVPLLPGTVHHGMEHRDTLDPLLHGAAVDGADGVVDHKWPPNQRLRGPEEEALVLVHGLNHPH